MKYFFASAIVLLLALQACKAPTSPNSTLSNPTLTIFAPDTAHVFDTVTFRAHYSDSVKASWKFAWQFGDSSSASTKDTSIAHVYDSAGTYTVRASLVDSNQKVIAKDSAQIKILPLNVPMLTLTVPDTNFWGDSCVMTVSSSQQLKAEWKFVWSLGDSSTISGMDTAFHYYLNPETYTVSVSLVDTIHHITLTSISGTVHVVARHFNLALLQSMKYVDVSLNAKIAMDTIPPLFIYDLGGYTSISPLSWNGTEFIMHSANGHDDSTYYGQTLHVDSASFELSESGGVDPALTQLANFFQDSNIYLYNAYPYLGLQGGGGTYKSTFTVNSIPFRSESNSELVFEAVANTIQNAQYNSTSFCWQIIGGQYYTHSHFKQVYSIIVRFHN